MTSYVALLRAVNVGGTGKLSMTELVSICRSAGFESVRTYIASGNAVFHSGNTREQVKVALEERLHARAGKPVGVFVRTAAEMAEVLARNPFREKAGNRTVAIFLDQTPPDDALDNVRGRNDEDLRLGKREIYVHYPQGMAHSKLTVPAAREGTARNMNTVAKLAEMASED